MRNRVKSQHMRYGQTTGRRHTAIVFKTRANDRPKTINRV